jgi:hypothetical protein
MAIKKKPFVKYDLDDAKSHLTMRLTDEEKEWILPAKRFIKQPKTSTAIKQLAKIGYALVLQRPEIATVLETVTENLRRNSRIGITETDYKME